jgi:hypothetical protein
MTKRTRSPKQIKSANQLTAAGLVEQLSAVRRTIQEVDHRGGIVRLIQDAALSEAQERTFTRNLGHGWKGLRSFVITVGDSRRARGLAVELCELPNEEAP